MTTQELIDYYAELLIVQYRVKPKAFATVQALVKNVIMDQIPFAVRDGFSVDTAVGDQLDVLGQYAGVSRSVLTFSGATVLTDSDYRILIKMKLLQNISGSSLYDIQTLIQSFFPGALQVFDNQNMTMGYYFNSTIGSSDLAEAFVRQGLLPKPMGVTLASLIYIADLTNIFGMRTYSIATPVISGFNSYDDYETDRPWLSYDNAITL